jgi:hypothetical protein
MLLLLLLLLLQALLELQPGGLGIGVGMAAVKNASCRRCHCCCLQVIVVHGERGTDALMISEQAAAAGLTSPCFAAHAPLLHSLLRVHPGKNNKLNHMFNTAFH